MPLEEIQRRFIDGSERAPAGLIAALRDDARAGARRLAARIERRRERARGERRRVAALFARERALHASGAARVAGVDEVGVGPLAGPVVAAAVVLPAGARLDGLDDSKRVRPAERERLALEIRAVAAAVAVGWATPDEIDRCNVYHAALLAMRRAVERLDPPADALLVDARTIPGVALPQEPLVDGDSRVASIAAASIVAKVYRDAWMRDLERRYPGYGFSHNAGYPTAEHRSALARLGPTPAHRFSFAPVREAAAAWRSVRARAAGG
jgi:ribonuclease HII